VRTTQIHCNRCGATILGGHSILRVEAGALASRLEGEPYIDLCGDCVERFQDWLRSGRNGELSALGKAVGGVDSGIHQARAL
jgi:hypothetical protein